MLPSDFNGGWRKCLGCTAVATRVLGLTVSRSLSLPFCCLFPSSPYIDKSIPWTIMALPSVLATLPELGLSTACFPW